MATYTNFVVIILFKLENDFSIIIFPSSQVDLVILFISLDASMIAK